MLPRIINDDIVRTAEQVQTSNRSTQIEVINYAPASNKDYTYTMYPERIQQIYRQILDANVDAIHKEMQAGHKSPLLRPSKVYVIDSLSPRPYPFTVGFRRTSSYFTSSSTEKIIAELSSQLIQHELQFVGNEQQKNAQADKYQAFFDDIQKIKENYVGGKIKRYFMSILSKYVDTDYKKTLQHFDDIFKLVENAVKGVRRSQLAQFQKKAVDEQQMLKEARERLMQKKTEAERIKNL